MDRPRASVKRLLHHAVTEDGMAGMVVFQRDDGAEFELVFTAPDLPQIIADLQTLAMRLMNIRLGLGDQQADIAPITKDALLPVKLVHFLHDTEQPGARILRCTLASGGEVSLRFAKELAADVGRELTG